MPRIELRDAFGMVYRIDTMDIRKIGPWFEEWLPRLTSGNVSIPAPTIQIWPLFAEDGRTPDWPFQPAQHVFDAEGAADLIVTLRTLFGISEDLPSEHDEPAAR